MQPSDYSRRFLVEGLPIRGQLVRLGAAWHAMCENHAYPEAVRDSLGEAVAASVLLSATLKFRGRLSLQLRGEGPLRLMVVECGDDLAVRGVARFDEQPSSRDLRALSGDGTLTVTVDNEVQGRRYQGIVPLSGERMADCLRGYFESSEQLPTRLWLAADGTRSAGLLLQRLPVESRPPGVTESGPGARTEEEVAEAWQRIQQLADQLEPAQLLGMDHEELLRKLAASGDLRVFESAPVFFRCSCSRERVENMLRTLGRGEVQSIVEEMDHVEVHCEFCGRPYRLDSIDALGLFKDPHPPSGLH